LPRSLAFDLLAARASSAFCSHRSAAAEEVQVRIFISADIEGIPGVVSRDQLMPGRFEYEAARDWMTDAVLCVCDELRAGGVSEMIVADSHGNGQNIRFERMPADVRLVRSWPRPLGMMQGVDVGDYAGALLIGYHAGAGQAGATLAHTMSGEFIHEVRLNGRPMSEAGVSAAIAGAFGVPILMVAGDDQAIVETRELLGDIATAEMKSSLGFLSALTLSPAAAEAALRQGVREALARVGKTPPTVISGRVVVEVRMRNRMMAEWLSYLEPIEQLDAFTIRYEARDMIAASRFFMFLTGARGGLE
jgi:D-amino peptidase